MSVKVAVRVRPFNQREKDMGAVLCVKMVGQTTSLIDSKSGSNRDFAFDYSFWSHDGYLEMENGYLANDGGSEYADQRHVYEQLGIEVLNNAWEGYNCCLFAYGQTGSGKSYSMVGYGTNKGIVPTSSEEIFTRINSNTDPNLVYEVTVSMLEIYNERVQDLLIPVNLRPQGGLKIRESKAAGVFVEGLSKNAVNSYAEIEHLMEMGNTHRSIGATQMNATSSRAHTIFTIELRQVFIEGNRKTEKMSVINLVDLAGSEKAGQTGATGDRLKEGCAINKSLVVLGTVIETLAEKSSGKKNNIVVPYRDSALTRILSTALGGNSKTVMICALSPASVNYEETLSTLRYADRAKKIKNNAVINESVQDRMIRELKEENNELKKLLEQAGGLDKIRELQEQLEANERFVKEQMMSWEQKRTSQAIDQVVHEDRSIPHITNINEDPQLSGKVYYNFKQLPLSVGRKNADPPVDVVLNSSSVRPRHCTFDSDKDDNITLTPEDMDSSEYLYVNGKKVTSTIVLNNLDRIIIGTSTVFLFKYPGHESELKEHDIDFEFAMQEKIDTTKKEVETHQAKSERRGSVKEIRVEESPQEEEQIIESPPEEPAQQTRRGLHSRLAKTFPMVNEANLLAKDLGKPVKFAVKIINLLPENVEKDEDLEPDNWEKVLKVEVIHNGYGNIWLWDPEKFEDRLCMLREMLDDPYQQSFDEDPLWDPPEEHLLGKGYYSLKPLGLLFDNPFDILIISTTGGDAGFLRMNIVPTTDEGEYAEEGPVTPEELIGKVISFRVEIQEARNIPLTHANNVYCEYNFPGLGLRRTSAVPGYCENPEFNYSEHFNGIYVDEDLCKFMQNKKLAISVYGTGTAPKTEAPSKVSPVKRQTYESTPARVPSVESEMERQGGRRATQPETSRRKTKEEKKDCEIF